MPILSVQNVGLKIQDHTILDGVSFDVEAGEVIGLIGPNGSGKTTLFNVLSGFLLPTTGAIRFKGQDLTWLPTHVRAQVGLGRVFQHFGIFREMSVRENVLVALEALPREQRIALGDLEIVIRTTLERVGLAKQSQYRASSLSGGQMRLLEIGRTLASGKDLFLLDEPTAGVSPKMTSQVADLIKELKIEGKTVLVVEHDLPFISRICDRVIVMDLGSVVLQGAPHDLKKSKELQELYFGADPTT